MSFLEEYFSLMQEKVLITGGAGFLGSHLCEALVNRGQNVKILDNLSSGTRENLREVETKSNGKLIFGDCKNPKDVRDAVSKVDIVYHLAANSEIRLDLTSPSTCFSENIYATYVLLEAIKSTKVDTIVFTSSSTVYGEAKTIPTPENYTPLDPISIYGASKLASEALITSYCHIYDKKALIIRLANVVGLRSKYGVINDFINKFRINPKKIEILGDGFQRKSYLHIDDCVNAILIARETNKSRIDVLNVGSDDQIKVKDIVEIIAEEMNLREYESNFTGGVDGGRGWPGDIRNMLLDTSKLKSRGWKPRYDSHESVRLTTKQKLWAEE